MYWSEHLRILDMKAMLIHIITGTDGNLPRSFQNHLEDTPAKHAGA
jgi:hypothetical protein